MYNRWDFPKGLEDYLDSHLDLGTSRNSRVWLQNRQLSSSSPVQNRGRGAPAGLAAGVAGDLEGEGSGKKRKTERGRRGSRWSLHLGQRRTERWPAAETAAADYVLRWRRGSGARRSMRSGGGSSRWRGAPRDLGWFRRATEAAASSAMVGGGARMAEGARARRSSDSAALKARSFKEL
jgi:hypothetical protein